MDPLTTKLSRLRWRLLWLSWCEALADALLFSASLACAWLLIARALSVVGDPLWAALGLCVFGLLLGTWRAYRYRPDLKGAAVAADLRLGLKERFTSSLEMAHMEGAMVEALHKDARKHVEVLNVRKHFPFEPTRSMKWLVIPIILFGLGYVLLPEMDLFGGKARMLEAKARKEAITAKAEQLRKTAKAIVPEAEADGVVADVTAEEIEAIAEQLANEAISEKQALARMQDLAQTLREQRRNMQEQSGLNQGVKPESLTMAREAAKAMEQGDMGAAAEALRKLKEKLKKGEMSDEDKKQLLKEMKALQKMVGKESTLGAALQAALKDIGSDLSGASMGDLSEALAQMELSLEDLASAFDQMAKLDTALQEIAEWQAAELGECEYCRSCGKSLKKCKNGKGCKGCKDGTCMGLCGACAGLGMGTKPGSGLGLRGPGQGVGNQVGELPESSSAYEKAVMKGPITEGKMLASVLQRGAPEVDEEATYEFVPGALVQVQQEAETALTQEEIPPDARDFVRGYFGALDSMGDEAHAE